VSFVSAGGGLDVLGTRVPDTRAPEVSSVRAVRAGHGLGLGGGQGVRPGIRATGAFGPPRPV